MKEFKRYKENNPSTLSTCMSCLGFWQVLMACGAGKGTIEAMLSFRRAERSLMF